MPLDAVGVAMLGAGNVGAGVIAALRAGHERYAVHIVRPLLLRRVLVRDTARARDGVEASVLTSHFEDILMVGSGPTAATDAGVERICSSMAAASWGRSSGSGDRAARRMARRPSGRVSGSGGASPERSAAIDSIACSRRNGWRPVAASWSTTAAEKTSDRVEPRAPSSRSGAT